VGGQKYGSRCTNFKDVRRMEMTQSRKKNIGSVDLSSSLIRNLFLFRQ